MYLSPPPPPPPPLQNRHILTCGHPWSTYLKTKSDQTHTICHGCSYSNVFIKAFQLCTSMYAVNH